MADDITYYSLFDGEDIGGKRYALGEPIDADVHPAALQALASQGRLSTSPPVAVVVVPADKKVDDMTRAELERAVVAATAERIKTASDEELRAAVERHRDAEDDDDGGAGDGSVGGTSYADLKDKPLAGMKTADLDTIAREEGVSFDGARNNADRVAAIEAKRAAA